MPYFIHLPLLEVDLTSKFIFLGGGGRNTFWFCYMAHLGFKSSLARIVSSHCLRYFWKKLCIKQEFATINIYLFIEIRHNILIQCHRDWIVLRWKIFNYMLEIERNLMTKYLWPEGWFLRVWVFKWHPDALLAKIMAQCNRGITVSCQCRWE